MKTTRHAALATYDALNSDGVTNYRLACGGVSTAVDSTDDSDRVTCTRCRKALAAAMPRNSRYSSDGLWRSLVVKEQYAVIGADMDVQSARKSLIEAHDDVIRTLASALADATRMRDRVAADAGLGLDSYGALDHAMEAGRVPAFVAGNVRIDMLARYGAALDQAIAACLRKAKLDGKEDA